MMSAKDARVATMRDLLRAMRAVKMLAWEPIFLSKVRNAACGSMHASV